MKTTAQDYSWLNDLSISEAGCLTVVPAADRQEALAAFGVLDGTARSFESLEDAVNGTERLPEQWVYVVEVGDALVLLEDNGYQGARPEVLRPASKASGTHKAAAFFWNVEGMTDFSAARRGKMQCSVELIGAEPEDLDGVPRALRRLMTETVVSHDEWDGIDEDGVPTEFLAEQLKHLELALTIATAPQQFLDLVQGAESRDACLSSLREAFGFDTAQALQALYTPVMNLTPFGLADLRSQHDRAAGLNARQEGPQD